MCGANLLNGRGCPGGGVESEWLKIGLWRMKWLTVESAWARALSRLTSGGWARSWGRGGGRCVIQWLWWPQELTEQGQLWCGDRNEEEGGLPDCSQTHLGSDSPQLATVVEVTVGSSVFRWDTGMKNWEVPQLGTGS